MPLPMMVASFGTQDIITLAQGGAAVISVIALLFSSTMLYREQKRPTPRWNMAIIIGGWMGACLIFAAFSLLVTIAQAILEDQRTAAATAAAERSATTRAVAAEREQERNLTAFGTRRVSLAPCFPGTGLWPDKKGMTAWVDFIPPFKRTPQIDSVDMLAYDERFGEVTVAKTSAVYPNGCEVAFRWNDNQYMPKFAYASVKAHIDP